MALPSFGVPLSLAAMRTEFNKSNPVSLVAYRAGAGIVPSGATGQFGAVPSSGATDIRSFYGLSAIVASVSTSWDETYNLSTINSSGSGFTSSSVTFFSTGKVLASGSSYALSNGKLWYSPETSGIGSSYWIRARLDPNVATSADPFGRWGSENSSNPSSGALNTWISLSTSPQWVNNASGGAGATSYKYSRLLFEISTSSSGSPIVASGFIGIEAAKGSAV